MIPFIATLAVQKEHGRSFRLWIPLGIIWLLLLPMILLLLPFFCIACLIIRVHPFDALSIFSQILAALKGLDLEVECPRTSIELRLL